jgi:hypothetical protein
MVLADVDACESVAELESIYGPLSVAYGGEGWALTVDRCVIVGFVPGHVKAPTRKSGQIDKSKVTRIRIEAIEAVR